MFKILNTHFILFFFVFVISAEGVSGPQVGPSPTQADSQIPGAIGFSEAYKEILSRSLRVESQRLSTEAFQERKNLRIGAFLPSVSAQAVDSQGNLLPGISTYAATLNASVNIFRTGGDIAGLQASKRDLASSREKLRFERQGTEDDAIVALTNVIAKSQTSKIEAKFVEIREESVRIARERFQRGMLAQQEVSKVLIELENARARLADALTQEADVRAQLKALLGHDLVALNWPWRDVLARKSPIEDAPFDLDLRPDWRASRLTVEAERLRQRQSFSSLLPSLDLTASYGSLDLSVPGRRDWSGVLTLSVPLFDGLVSLTNYRLQKITEQLAEVNSESIRRTAPAAVESLRLAYKTTKDSAIDREKTAQLAERLYTDNFQRFRLGRVTANDLAIDQDRLLQSQLLAINGWLNAHSAYSRLCHGLGRYVDANGGCVAEVSGL